MNIRVRGPSLLLLLRSHTDGLTFTSRSQHRSVTALASHRHNRSTAGCPPSITQSSHGQYLHPAFATRFRGGSSSPSSCDTTARHASTTTNSADVPTDGPSNTETTDEILTMASESLSIAGPPLSHFAQLPYLHTTPTTTPTPHRVLFILGGPGAGKGTQSALIVSTYRCVHLSAGDLLRNERASGGEHAELIERCLVAGEIVPVEITLDLLKRAMDLSVVGEEGGCGSPIFLVDGFPRNRDNLSGWTSLLPSSFARVLGALVYDCPVPVLTERILGRAETSGRSDDNLASALKRFATFERETAPVVRALEMVGEERGGGEGMKVVRVQGDGTVEEVWEGTVGGMDGFVRHDILTGSAELLRCVEGGDWEGWRRLCGEGMFEVDDGLATATPGEEMFRKYEGMPEAAVAVKEGKELRYSNSDAVVDVYDGTEATVSYDRRVETGEGELVAEFRETRVWSHRSTGWVCIHFVRKPVGL